MNLRHLLVRIAALLTILLVLPCFADVSVRGYYRKDGTYVRPHKRSSPNSTKSDNWSTKGNVNPYTGKAGTKSVDDYQSPSSSSGSSGASGRGTHTGRTSRFGGYPSTPYIPQGPPKAEGGWSDKKDVLDAPRVSRPEPAKAKKEPRATDETPAVDENSIVYCVIPLSEYHWREDCKMLSYSHVSEKTLNAAKSAKYSLCKTCMLNPPTTSAPSSSSEDIQPHSNSQ